MIAPAPLLPLEARRAHWDAFWRWWWSEAAPEPPASSDAPSDQDIPRDEPTLLHIEPDAA